MPNFNGIVVTNSGKTLLAKAQLGKELRFTKMQLGSANDILNPNEKTNVTSPFLTTDIRNVDLTTDGSARISTFISNKNLTQSYVWREIGLFALDPDTNEEILYAYKCAGESGETIPAGGGADAIEKIFDIIIKVQNATNITAVINDSTVLLSREEVVQELNNCAEEQYKVPSAQLFYNELQTINNIINTIQDDTKKAIEGTVLYTNSKGVGSDIEFTDNLSNYKYIEIDVGVIGKLYAKTYRFPVTQDIRYYEKPISLEYVEPASSSNTILHVVHFMLTDTTMSRKIAKTHIFANSSISTSTSSNLLIFEIRGYK